MGKWHSCVLSARLMAAQIDKGQMAFLRPECTAQAAQRTAPNNSRMETSRPDARPMAAQRIAHINKKHNNEKD